MVKIVHISDIHFGASLKGSSYASELSVLRQREIKETFFDAVKYASENADFLIIAGDLFETEFMRKSDVDSVFNAFAACKATILMITGNHDPLKQNSFWHSRDLPKHVFLFEDQVSKISFDEFNLDVYGHSWNTYYIEEEVFRDVTIENNDRINILIAHGDIYQKKTQYLPIDKDNLTSLGFDYIALGHIHKPDFITPRIAYPGSLEPFDFKETGEHGFIEIKLDKETFHAEFKQFAKREFKLFEVDITPENTEDDIINKLQNIDVPGNKKTHMYRVVLSGRHSAGVSVKEHELYEILKREFFYLEIRNNTKLDYDLEVLLDENKDNIIGKYIEYFRSLDEQDEITQIAFELGLEKLLNSKEGLL